MLLTNINYNNFVCIDITSIFVSTIKTISLWEHLKVKTTN